MKKIDLKEIDDLRKKNLRPVVVGCFLNENRILFVYKKEHDLWQLPQGGILNKEKLVDAFLREMSEELGIDFVNGSRNCQYFGQDELLFPSRLHGSRELETDEGEKIEMKGKAYLFCKTNVLDKKLEIEKSEFDDYRWIDLSKAKEFVTQNIYQKGKQKMTLNALDNL